MATIFGKRSAYLSNHAWGALLVLALLMLPIVGISAFGPTITKAGYAGLLVVAAIMLITMNAIEKRKKIIYRWLNGLEGEGAVVGELQKLPDGFAVFRGIKANGRSDIDCTVVGPTGVYAVEVKSHKGTIGFNGRELTRNGRRFEKDFLRQASQEALALRDKIRSRAKISLYVEAVIVFSSKRAAVGFGRQPVRGCRVIGRGWLNDFLQGGSGQALSNEFILKIANVLAAETPDGQKEEKLKKLSGFLQ